jgi:putative IMPACT (imprinted ancient) family translation regulator
VGDIVAVVTRYFGGTLLGKGGLVRAYSGGVQLALETLPVAETVARVTMVAVIEYGALSSVRRVLPEYEAEVVAEEFAADVSLHLLVPEEQAEGLGAALIDLTNGQALVEIDAAG